MSGGFGRLASNDSSELWRFDTYALGYAGLVLAEVGILTNIIALGILFCSLLGNLHLHIGLAISDASMLVVWGTYYCIPYLLRELPLSNETWDRWIEPIADLFQTFTIYFLLAIAFDVTLNKKTQNYSKTRKALTVILIPLLGIVINLPKFVARFKTSLLQHQMYVWIYDYTSNYLLRYILPFFVLACLSLRTSFFLTPGRKDSRYFRIVTTQGLVLFNLLCYAPFIVNYTIYAAKILSQGEESWKEIAADMKVRKLNTFCYLLIMLGSASRLFIYLTFHPSLRKCRCRCSSEWNDETEHVIESTFQRSYPNYRPQPTARGNRYTVEPICDDAETTAADSQFLQLADASFKGPRFKDTLEGSRYPKVLPTLAATDLRNSGSSLSAMSSNRHQASHQLTLDSGRGTIGSNNTEWRPNSAIEAALAGELNASVRMNQPPVTTKGLPLQPLSIQPNSFFEAQNHPSFVSTRGFRAENASTSWTHTSQPWKTSGQTFRNANASQTTNLFHIRQPLEETTIKGAVAGIRCTICKQNIKDDVVHFMMECPKFWRERSEYLRNLSLLNASLVSPTLGPDDRFAAIVRCVDDRVKHETSEFLKRIRQKRTTLLDSAL